MQARQFFRPPPGPIRKERSRRRRPYSRSLETAYHFPCCVPAVKSRICRGPASSFPSWEGGWREQPLKRRFYIPGVPVCGAALRGEARFVQASRRHLQCAETGICPSRPGLDRHGNAECGWRSDVAQASSFQSPLFIFRGGSAPPEPSKAVGEANASPTAFGESNYARVRAYFVTSPPGAE